MDFGLLPPEVNSGLIYTGPGSGPLLAAAAGWAAVAAQLESAADGFSSAVSELTGWWVGPSSMRMAAAATPYVGWLHTSAVQAAHTAAQAHAAAGAYEAAFAMTVPPPVVAANRIQLTTLIATNFLGQNTPAIAATEAQYMEMWVQDATAMYTYAAVSEVASTLTSYEEPPHTTNQGGQADQARAAAQTAQQVVSNATQPASGTLGPGQSINYNGVTIVNDAGSGTVSYNIQGSLSGSGTIYLENGASINIEQGGSLFIAGGNGRVFMYGGSFNIGYGGAVNIGSNGYLYISNFAGVGILNIGNGGTVTLPTNSALSVTTTVTIQTSTVTGAVNSYVYMQGNGILSIQAGITSGTAQMGQIYGNGLTIAAAAPVPPPPPPVTPPTVAPTASGLGPLSGLSSAPGLTGTAGIQPQLNVEGILEWAQTASGAEVAVAAG